MEIIIKPHSFVDVITNSSTVIYTQFFDSAIPTTYELISEVLMLAGSDKKAKDLFDVSIHPDLERIYDYLDGIEDDEIEGIIDGDDDLLYVLRQYCEYRSKYIAKEIEWKVFDKWQDDTLTPILLTDDNWEHFIDDETCCNTYLKITAKDKSKSTKDLGKLINSMFTCEESYDG